MSNSERYANNLFISGHVSLGRSLMPPRVPQGCSCTAMATLHLAEKQLIPGKYTAITSGNRFRIRNHIKDSRFLNYNSYFVYAEFLLVEWVGDDTHSIVSVKDCSTTGTLAVGETVKVKIGAKSSMPRFCVLVSIVHVIIHQKSFSSTC